MGKCWRCGKEHGDSESSFLFFEWGDIIRVRKCDKCGKNICQICGKGGCPSCEALRREQERLKKEEKRLEIVKRMRVYSINYEGKIPVDLNQPYQEIDLEDYGCRDYDADYYLNNGWFMSKENALEALKYIVSDEGFDLIYKLQYFRDTCEEETDSGGTYYYTVWSCKCIAGHQKAFSKK